ncbi:hypothetical protein BS47DRAFT_1360349 [Hydnum rufescens UP504]|uniref:Uncharacterized protein n=1 Tax=Hydnum rufescens UP504 TaxID=1448309 RepID=A0A9P6B2Q0_9AGAM|nr:hypothetical protein BS47DRAFT_1360349 [Hydnum rufescens UP504]
MTQGHRGPRQTTHPLRWVPSLCENPHTGKPQVHTATQAQSAHPLNTTIDEIAYHTPTAVGCRKAPKEQQKLLFCTKTPCTKKGCAQPPATRNSIQEPSARTPTSMPQQMKYHTPTVVGLPSMHETPPNKNTDEKPMCAATRNPIEEPAAASQNEYHTRFGSPQNDNLQPATCPMVNCQAQPLVPHPPKWQWYHTSTQVVPHPPNGCGANFLRDGTTPAQVGVY